MLKSKSTKKALLLINNYFGFSVAEAVIAAAFFAIIATSLISALIYFNALPALIGLKTRAIFLAEQGIEASRNLRDNNFINLVDGTHGLNKSSGQWSFAGSLDTADGFARQIVVSSLDSDTKKIISQVSWSSRGNDYNTSLIGRLTNWQKIITSIGDWSTTTIESRLDLPGINDGRKIQVIGDYAYIVRADGSPDFVIADISDTSSPFVVGSLSLTGGPTNIFVTGNYAYVSSDDDNGELKIINISNPSSPSLVGTYNAAGAGNGNGLYVIGNNVYLGRTNSGSNPGFLIINVTNPASPALLGSMNVGQVVYEVVVSGNYAYLATGDNNFELRVVNISNPAALSYAGSLNLSGTTDSITIALAGNKLFMGQGSSLHVINISNPPTPSLLGSLAVGGTLNDIALNLGNSDNYLFITTSDAASEFKVINLSTPASPAILGQEDIPGASPLLGIAYDSSLDRAFAVGQSNLEELVIIAPN
ncbi:hypothetical protein GYA54_03865 [Candidatus Kuenenbacteria bacterium]|nr:hypothetical protein [Candidatus Kuenenbacteria bacterium]